MRRKINKKRQLEPNQKNKTHKNNMKPMVREPMHTEMKKMHMKGEDKVNHGEKGFQKPKDERRQD